MLQVACETLQPEAVVEVTEPDDVFEGLEDVTRSFSGDVEAADDVGVVEIATLHFVLVRREV